jgi:hypothetical protein
MLLLIASAGMYVAIGHGMMGWILFSFSCQWEGVVYTSAWIDYFAHF